MALTVTTVESGNFVIALKAPSRPEIEADIRLIELRDGILVLKLPTSLCEGITEAEVKIFQRLGSGKRARNPLFSVQTRVENWEIEPKEPMVSNATFAFEVDPREWRKFIGLVSEQQGDVNRKLRGMRGLLEPQFVAA